MGIARFQIYNYLIIKENVFKIILQIFVFFLKFISPNFYARMGNISQLLDSNSKHGEILSMAGKLAFDEKISAYVVGGYVRDMLLGRSSNDIDIMVEGDGIEFAKKLSKELQINITVDYDKFGTALIPHPELEIEIASARKEEYETYSRKPKILMCQ